MKHEQKRYQKQHPKPIQTKPKENINHKSHVFFTSFRRSTFLQRSASSRKWFCSAQDEGVGVWKMAMGQKEKPNGDHRFWSIFPFTKGFFGVPGDFDPQPNVFIQRLQVCVDCSGCFFSCYLIWYYCDWFYLLLVARLPLLLCRDLFHLFCFENVLWDQTVFCSMPDRLPLCMVKADIMRR